MAKKPRKPPKTIQGVYGNKTQGETMGRPPAGFDIEVVKEACAIMCTAREAAALCRISIDTLERRLKEHRDEDFPEGCTFSQFFEVHSAYGRASLRRSLFKSAEWHDPKNPGDTRDRQFLAKQKTILGMTDRSDVGFDPDRPVRFVMSMGKKLKGETDDDEIKIEDKEKD